jgi:hypothetical protein
MHRRQLFSYSGTTASGEKNLKTKNDLHLVGILLALVSITPNLLQAQPDTSAARARSMLQSSAIVQSICLSAGHSDLDFPSGVTDVAATSLVIELLPFRKPVFISMSAGGYWGEEDMDTVRLVVVMPELSAGIACNFLAVPTVDRLLTNVIPADLLLNLGVRASLDYAPYLLQHDYDVSIPDSVETMHLYWDHVSWSYRVFSGFILDKSVGLMTEIGASKPLAGELRVTRSFLRFGLIFRL